MADSLFASPVSQALGWALVQFVWQGTLAGAGAAITLALLSARRANLRYLAGCGWLALMIALPCATALQRYGDVPASNAIAAPVAGAIDARTERPAVRQDVPRISVGTASVAPPDASARRAFDLEGWLPFTVTAWLAGVIVLSLRLVGGGLVLRRLRRRGTRAVPEPCRVCVTALASRLRIMRQVQIFESALVQVPTVIGCLRPVILMPASALTGLPGAHLEAVIAHELAHVRRHDYLVNLLQSVVETLLFYHPAVWWVSRRVRIEREHCCDDIAAGACGDRVAYARALADLEGLQGAGSRLALAASGGSLIARIRRLVGAPDPRDVRTPAWLAAVAVGGVLTVVLAGGAQGPTPPQPADAPVPREWAAPAMLEDPPMPPLPAPRVPRPPRAPRVPLPPMSAEVPLPPVPAAPAMPAPPLKPEFVPVPLPPLPAAPVGVPLSPPPPAPPPPPRQAAPPRPPVPPSPARLDEDEQGERHMAWSDGRTRLDVRLQGTIELTDDDRDVARMGSGSFMTIVEHRSERRIELRANADGTIARTFWSGGAIRAFDPEGRAWLAEVLQVLVRRGFVAEHRMARLFKAGGPDAVLTEISRLETDHARAVYHKLLWEQRGLSSAARAQALRQAGTGIESDYELAEVLLRAIQRSMVNEPEPRDALIDATVSIESDYELRRVLDQAVAAAGLPPAALTRLLHVAESIQSDYELTELLTAIAAREIPDAALTPFFGVANTVQSSYERGRVLGAVVSRPNLSDAALLGVLRTADGMTAYELSTLLIAVAGRQRVEGPVRESYTALAEGIASEFEQDRALAALARKR